MEDVTRNVAGQVVMSSQTSMSNSTWHSQGTSREPTIQLLQRGFIITSPGGGPLDVSDVVDGTMACLRAIQDIIIAGGSDEAMKTSIQNALSEDSVFSSSVIPSMKAAFQSMNLSSEADRAKKMSDGVKNAISLLLTTFLKKSGSLYYGKTVYIPELNRLMYFKHGTTSANDSWEEVWS